MCPNAALLLSYFSVLKNQEDAFSMESSSIYGVSILKKYFFPTYVCIYAI